MVVPLGVRVAEAEVSRVVGHGPFALYVQPHVAEAEVAVGGHFAGNVE